MRTITGYLYYPDSLEERDGVTYFLARSEEDNQKYLGVMGRASGFQEGRGIARDSAASTHLFPLSLENAALLRERLPWLRPQPVGLRASFGFGDRIGMATPGHVRALQESAANGAAFTPIFAQQSVRENARTRRSPQQVMDDAMWGVFQTGWRLPWGADADHLKTTDDIDAFYEAGFTFFTIDPGDYVDNAAQDNRLPELRSKAEQMLSGSGLAASLEEMKQRYVEKTFPVEDFTVLFTEESLLRALVKYGQAILHTIAMANHLNARSKGQPPDLEISVDETATPTTIAEHYFIASELRRAGVQWNSLAPRFTGRFEKGSDYIGGLPEFEQDFARHAAIARSFGSYRLSLHSGSDKFSIYPACARAARGLLHVKTAGTSYLEALRVIAQRDPGLFRMIYHLAVERYEEDRASYHVSAELARIPALENLPDAQLASLLDQFDARQAFHVTYGAVFDRFYPEFIETLRADENLYYEAIDRHFRKHLSLLARQEPVEPA